MSKRDYYEVLGCDRNASADELKKAYRKLAMQYHPDRNPDDASASDKFKELNEAYDVLKDEQKRAAYDRFGHAAFDGGGRGGGGFADFGFGGGGGGFSDLFEEMLATSWVAAVDGAAKPRAGAPICASTWKSAWRTPSPANRPPSRCRPRRSAIRATAPAARTAASR